MYLLTYLLNDCCVAVIDDSKPTASHRAFTTADAADGSTTCLSAYVLLLLYAHSIV